MKTSTIYWIAGGIATLGVAFLLFRRSQLKRDVVAVANNEWARFGYQTRDSDGNWVVVGLKENDNAVKDRVGDYWKNVGRDSIDGSNRDYAWSSAFISFIMSKVGGMFGIPWKKSSSHSRYIREYVKNRKEGKLDEPFVAYRINELPAQVGDLVCYAREDTEDDPYDRTSSYASHCDIVVARRPNEIEVIGGNVAHSVSKKVLKAVDGYVLDDHNRWFAIIKNNV